MKKVEIQDLTASALSDVVNNSKVIFNDELGLNLTLNQIRHKVAQQFGAKAWGSLVAAVESSQQLLALSKNMLLNRQEEFRILPETLFDDFDLTEFIIDAGINEVDNPKRFNELFSQIKKLAELDDESLLKVYQLFSPRELMGFYFKATEQFSQFERIASTFIENTNTVITDGQVLYYDFDENVAVVSFNGELKVFACDLTDNDGFAFDQIDWSDEKDDTEEYFEFLELEVGA